MVHIIRNSFSLCAAQSGYCFLLTTVKSNLKNEGLAMVQDPCNPETADGHISQHLYIPKLNIYLR